jgi:hypothetical protein
MLGDRCVGQAGGEHRNFMVGRNMFAITVRSTGLMNWRKEFRRSKPRSSLEAGAIFSCEASRRNSCEAETERVRASERILEGILQLPGHPRQPKPES